MIVSEKRIAANRRNIELGREKSKEAMHRIKERNDRLVECECECEHCHVRFIKMIKTIDKEKGRLPRFCSRSCANSRIRTDGIKKKVSATLAGVRYVNGKRLTIESVKCKQCGCDITSKAIHNHRSFCSDECRCQYLKNYKELAVERSIQKYRKACAFKFSLNSYPDEFDFGLIETYGWYSAKNHKNNPNGVSRDHMYSVKEGFKNKVSPLLISHPANCQLLRQLDNGKKSARSTITLEELMARIKIWNEKYGEYKPKIMTKS